VDGITIRAIPGGQLMWVGKNYFGQPSKDILNYRGQGLTITFDQPVDAVGFDLLALSGGFGDGAQIAFFNGNTLLDRYGGISIPSPPEIDAPAKPVFFGYGNNEGITFINISGGLQLYSPILDNLTFGNIPQVSPVPTPNGFVMAAIGSLILVGFRWNRSSKQNLARSNMS
jgi:hypothetical protein